MSKKPKNALETSNMPSLRASGAVLIRLLFGKVSLAKQEIVEPAKN
jgi:hypothetical protein